MSIIKRKKIGTGENSQTIELAKLRNKGRRGGYDYVVRDSNTKGLLADPYGTRKEAMKEFRATAGHIQRAIEAEKRDAKRERGFFDLGIGGGGEKRRGDEDLFGGWI